MTWQARRIVRHTWAASMLCATFVWIAACSLGASGATQVTLNTIAEASLVVPQDTREAFHVREDARCREAFPPGSHPYSAWRDCMERSFWLDASVGTLDATLRAAQASLDAGDSGSVRRALPCVARAAARASDAFREAGLEVPADVSRLLDVGAEVSGGCPE